MCKSSPKLPPQAGLVPPRVPECFALSHRFQCPDTILARDRAKLSVLLFSIWRRLLVDMVDHQHRFRALLFHQLQAKFLADRVIK